MSTLVANTVNRRLLIAVLAYTVWILCFAYFNYCTKKTDLFHHIDELLISTALVTPSLLPVNLHRKGMSPSDITTEQSFDLAKKLSNYALKTEVIYIYSLIKEGDKIFFTSSSATQEELDTGQGVTYYFDEYDTVDPRVHQVFENGETLFIEYTDQWGSFRSVFIPHKAEDGRMYVVAADMPTSYITTILKEDFYQTVVITILFLGFMFPVYLAMTRKVTSESRRLTKQVRQQNRAILEQSERLNLALKSAQQSWFDIDLRRNTITIDKGYNIVAGDSQPATVKLNLNDWHLSIHPDDRDFVINSYEKVIRSNTNYDLEYRQRDPNGGYIWVHSTGELVAWDRNESDQHFFGINTNITERKQSEIVLRTFAESVSTSKLDIFAEIVTELALSHNVDTALISQIDSKNPLMVNTLAVWSKGKLIDNISYPLLGTPCEKAIEVQACFYPDNIQSLFPKDHLLVEMSASSYIGASIINQKGQHIGLIAMLDSDTMQENSKTERLLKSLAVRVGLELERLADEEKLRLSRQVIESAHEGIVITDKDGIIIDVNPTFTQLTGYSKEEVIGESYLTNHSKLSPEEFYKMVFNDLDKKGHWQGEVTSIKKDGNIFTQLLSMSAMTNANGDVTHFIGLFSDISSLKKYQKSLELLAHYDQLTGLPNRALFADRYQQAIAHSKRNDTSLAVCFIDLDHFKPINDNYGHEMGDQLLINVANRLISALRGEDTACRFGGDEFALLLLGIESIKHCEDTIKRVLETLTRSYNIGSQVFEITASCGVTIYPEDSADLDTLIRHADQAMYEAKVSGRNQFKFFDQNVLIEKSNLSPFFHAIEHGLKHDEFELHYQPKVDVKSGKVFGVEALIRWNHPEKGLLYPDSFLPQVAGLPLESNIGEWVIKKAIEQLEEWNSEGLYLHVSVNISSHHLQSPYFIEQLDNVFNMYPSVNSSHLELEILETSALGEHKIVSRIIQGCEEQLGIRVALDDFGTGYSSLTHLRNLPAQTIKIDRTFIADLLDDPNDYSIIEGVISLSNAFNRNLIAEGVETEEHGLMLLTMGCHSFQGYCIAKPMPAAAVSDWLKEYKIPTQWLNYYKKELDEQELLKLQFKLVSDSWVNSLISMTFDDISTYSHWPILDLKGGHHAIWLKQVYELHNMDKAEKKRLKMLHKELYSLANELVVFCENEHHEQAKKQLDSVIAANQQLYLAVEKVLSID